MAGGSSTKKRKKSHEGENIAKDNKREGAVKNNDHSCPV